ncbi:MAG: YceI family protein [Bacteroidetes bacterium]|nr:YceI family protein [Bacteroidota bacterium]
MATFNIDPTHSEVQFKVKHLVITTVTGRFKKFEASMQSEKEDFSDAKISFSADVNSIDTNNEQRDGHLKSDDFFNAEKYPALTFTSKKFKKVTGNDYKLIGDLTIRNITKSVELNVEYSGTAVDPWGNTKVGFEISGAVNRFDYELKWNTITEAGGAMVGADIKLALNIQLVKAA